MKRAVVFRLRRATTNNEGITNLGGKKLEKDGKRFQDDVVTLKTAIEEAIREGQKSTDDLKDIPRSGRVSKRTLPSPA